MMPEPNSGCWLWLGALTPDGYGQFGELVALDFAGRFGGRQTWAVRPDPRPLPAIPAVGSYMSASIGWLL